MMPSNFSIDFENFCKHTLPLWVVCCVYTARLRVDTKLTVVNGASETVCMFAARKYYIGEIHAVNACECALA